MKDLMVTKENNDGNPTTKKVVFIVIAVFVVSIVLLNLLNYIVSFK